MLFRAFALFLLCLLSAVSLQAASPSILYLTWIHDPTTTMTIQWHTLKLEKSTQVLFRKRGELEWQQSGGVYSRLPKTDILVHTVELVDLEPHAEYEFQVQGKEGVYRFRTLPRELEHPVRFVVGGDAYLYLNRFRQMNREIAGKDPDFIIVGGDIAYTHGRKNFFRTGAWQVRRLRTFLKEWKEQMVTSDGRLIPILPVLGNHDVQSGDLNPFSNRSLIYELFAMPEKGLSYRTLDCGNYLSLWLLDTGHSFHIGGRQAAWLKGTLAERENTPYKIAAYHIAGYPSVYPYRGATPRHIRAQWSPIFERYHLHAAFEHHNHAYKRTHPIRGGKVDPDGVVYVGDGAWGVSPRKPRNSALWYMAKAERANVACLVTLEKERAWMQAFSEKGALLDEITLLPTRHEIAADETRLLVY